ncbi:D-erythrulose-4-phosphate isomerase 1, partial [Streptomyces olivaceus]
MTDKLRIVVVSDDAGYQSKEDLNQDLVNSDLVTDVTDFGEDADR